MMKKIKFIILGILLLPSVVFAGNQPNSEFASSEEIFKAKVIKIISEKEVQRENGTITKQQNILLQGLEGAWENKGIVFQGISDLFVVSVPVYKVGDKVLVQKTITESGENIFFITDYVRKTPLYALLAIFIIIILIIGRFKGVRSLFGLLLSFFIIVKLILPLILSGANPALVGLVGSAVILTLIIYINEGWNAKSHVSIFSILISLSVTAVLVNFFTYFTKLSGFAEENATFLLGTGKQIIDFKGLLMAGMLIGATGVLDDVVVGQVEAVKQIKEINPELNTDEVYQRAFKIGNAHLGAIVNTLFLTYAGAALPLLLLFVVNQEPFLSFSEIINNEIIATEIVRTLVGSIGIAASVPIATYFSARFLKVSKM